MCVYVCLGKSVHVPTYTAVTSLLSHSTSNTGTDSSTRGTERACVYVRVFKTTPDTRTDRCTCHCSQCCRQRAPCSDMCLCPVCVQERPAPLKKRPAGERWTNSRAASRESWRSWRLALRGGRHRLCVERCIMGFKNEFSNKFSCFSLVFLAYLYFCS